MNTNQPSNTQSDILSPSYPIHADLSSTPIVICNSDLKIAYKNKAAYLLGFKRIGSYITNLLSSEQKKCLFENDFSLNPCLQFQIDLDSVCHSAFICSYPHSPGYTIWIFPHDNIYKSMIIANKSLIFPLIATQLVTKVRRNYQNSNLTDAIGHRIFSKCLNMMADNYSSADSAKLTHLTNACFTLKHFCHHDLGALPITIDVDRIPLDNKLFLCDFNKFFCLFIGLLLNISIYYSNIKVYISAPHDRAYFCILAGNGTLPCDKDKKDILSGQIPELELCFKLFKHLGYPVTTYYTNKEEGFEQFFSMEASTSLPGMMTCTDEVYDCMELYNNFHIFLQDT